MHFGRGHKTYTLVAVAGRGEETVEAAWKVTMTAHVPISSFYLASPFLCVRCSIRHMDVNELVCAMRANVNRYLGRVVA